MTRDHTAALRNRRPSRGLRVLAGVHPVARSTHVRERVPRRAPAGRGSHAQVERNIASRGGVDDSKAPRDEGVHLRKRRAGWHG